MEDGELLDNSNVQAQVTVPKPAGGVIFLSKKQREKLKADLEEAKAREEAERREECAVKRQLFLAQLESERQAAAEEQRRLEVDLKNEDELTQQESVERASKLELEQLKNEYLGVRQDRRKIQKPSEKFRNVFQFEWDGNDDTTKKDFNAIYTQKYDPQLLFGRGFRAGIDVREQRKKNTFYDDLSFRRQKFPHLEVMNSEHQTRNQTRKIMKKRTRELDDISDEEEYTVETKPLSRMTERDWRILREDYNIAIKNGMRVPPPLRRWSEATVDDELLQAIERCGYVKPTPIQMQAIPIGLALLDMIGIAETGSGKTCAFMVPLIAYVRKLPRLNDETAQLGPYGLVLAPARELALQISEEGNKFASENRPLKYSRNAQQPRELRLLPIVGGRNAEEQGHRLRDGVEIIVATPGRLKDCLDRAYTVLTQCNYIVLDEADRMIDMGLEKEVNEILDQVPSTKPDDWLAHEAVLKQQAGYRNIRITHMFTATMPASVEKMAKAYLKDPCIVQIGTPGERKQNIEQRIEMVHQLKKQARLIEVLRSHLRRRAVPLDDESGSTHVTSSASHGGVIVFVNQKKSADVISRALNQNGISAVSLHGGKLQDVREDSLDAFKKQEVSVLVATDVAGRGIDVEDVQLVVNLDIPADFETYTHRIGRTGRAGKQGQAISFVTEDDPQYLVEAGIPLVGNATAPRAMNNQKKDLGNIES